MKELIRDRTYEFLGHSDTLLANVSQHIVRHSGVPSRNTCTRLTETGPLKFVVGSCRSEVVHFGQFFVEMFGVIRSNCGYVFLADDLLFD